MIVHDHTRSDIGFPVARVVVPGLRHFWGRDAPGSSTTCRSNSAGSTGRADPSSIPFRFPMTFAPLCSAGGWRQMRRSLRRERPIWRSLSSGNAVTLSPGHGGLRDALLALKDAADEARLTAWLVAKRPRSSTTTSRAWSGVACWKRAPISMVFRWFGWCRAAGVRPAAAAGVAAESRSRPLCLSAEGRARGDPPASRSDLRSSVEHDAAGDLIGVSPRDRSTWQLVRWLDLPSLAADGTGFRRRCLGPGRRFAPDLGIPRPAVPRAARAYVDLAPQGGTYRSLATCRRRRDSSGLCRTPISLPEPQSLPCPATA